MTTTATRQRPPLQPAELALIADAAAAVAVPRTAPVSSFVLHAPLELLARVGLLELLPASHAVRSAAVGRIEALRDRYAAAGEPIPAPAPAAAPLPGTPDDHAGALLRALHAGDVEAVDRAACAVLPAVAPARGVELLAAPLVPSLAAAGHAPIGLHLLARVGVGIPLMVLRPTLRHVASNAGWKLTWFEKVAATDREEDGVGSEPDVLAVMRSAPHLGRPGSDFIFPLMSQAEDSGHAARLLAPLVAAPPACLGPAPAAELSRIAAWSMVHDDPGQAPYGWSHALTMPQAVMSLAGRGVSARVAFAVAATYLLGFRMAHGLTALPAEIGPGRAPSAGWEELVSYAAAHDDAHLVKYTLAAVHAATDDPEFAPLYVAAAHHLCEWWAARPPAQQPL